MKIQKEVRKEILKLAISAFGLVAALAWNEFIKELVDVYIKPFVGKSSGVVSLGIYAVIVTCLAVLVTYSLTRIANRK